MAKKIRHDCDHSFPEGNTRSVSVNDLIKIEVKKTEERLEYLKSLLNKDFGDAIRVCPQCGTKNYNYSVKNNLFVCAFC